MHQVYSTNSADGIVANPIPSVASGSNYLVLFGTGIAAGGTTLTTVTINGVNAPVLFAGPQGTETGLDQVDVQIQDFTGGQG